MAPRALSAVLLIVFACFLAVLSCFALGTCGRVPDPPRGLEVALVLDNSGSMRIGGKDAALREASARFVEILRAGRGNSPLEILFGSDDQLWLSVIPFAGRVNLRGREEFFTQPPPDWLYLCPQGRAGTLGGGDRPLAAGRLRHFNWAQGPERLKKLVCPPNAVIGPTRWLLTLPRRLRQLSFAKRCSRVDLATVWAWRALSPRWWRAWHGDTEAPGEVQGDDRSRKVVVIVTDGRNSPQCALDNIGIADADAQFAGACKAMKRQGMVIYTVALEGSGSDARDLLASCASSARHARRGKDLVPVMEALAQELARLSPEPPH
ncbi:MAG: hypothetical protein QNJ30_25600 [Kiloniellales bacterium]|nr:hypothetical protein [Kiloniellales bacterium]